MNIKDIKTSDIKAYKNNAKKHDDKQIKAIASSLEHFGFRQPLVLDKNNEIVVCHGRFEAAKLLGYDSVPCEYADDLTDEQIKAYRLADNKLNESPWDFDSVDAELESIGDSFDMSAFGFAVDNPAGEVAKQMAHESLTDKFVVPPFSILDTRQGYWQDRKKAWKDLGIKSEIGRDAKAFSTGKITEQYGRQAQNETSIFDPVLCEIMYKWFCTDGGQIYDCFAGGSVRGIVAAKLGYKYTGIDIRQEQIDANIQNAKDIGVNPTWYCDDSANADKYIDDNTVDMIFSCPPYGDLEVYSDNPKDISNMEYDDFCKAYKVIIDKACNKLKSDRFAVFVVGDIRDKKGAYRNFVDYTKQCFNDNGLVTYNEAILIDMLGTAMIRASQTFKNRKLVKVHQNVLIFYKGDIKNIKNNFGNVDADAGLDFGVDSVEMR